MMMEFLKSLARRILNTNLYLKYIFYKVYAMPRRLKLEKTVSILNKDNPIENISSISKYRQKVDTENAVFVSPDRVGANSRVYGLRESIFSAIKGENLFVPAIEHGFIASNNPCALSMETLKPTILTFGDFRKQIIRKATNRLVFCVGPYINYTTPIYDDEKMSSIKQRIGKNLLVFPSHGTDDCYLTYDEKIFLEKIEEEKRNYDSVTVSAFWWDVNGPLVKRMEKLGYKISCNGFREDPLFLKRLRTLIELCDLAIGDSIGTHVGYCVALKKPYCLFNGETSYSYLSKIDSATKDFSQQTMGKIKSVFKNKKMIDSDVLSICKYYWGDGYFRTQDELLGMYNINKKISMISKGFVKRYTAVANRLLNEYPDNSLEKKLLLEGLQD